MRESMQVTMATPAWATPSKPARAKFSENRRLASSRSSKALSVTDMTVANREPPGQPGSVASTWKSTWSCHRPPMCR